MDNIVGQIKATNTINSTINRTNTINSTIKKTNTIKSTTTETNGINSTIKETNTIKSTVNYPGAGDSAYQVAVKNGFVGTEQEWLASLKGDTGPQGDSYVLTNEDKQEIADIVKTDISGTTTEETDPTVPEHVKKITEEDIDKWNNPDFSEVDNNYNNATNKPSINGIELVGNKTTEDLKINKIIDEGNYFNSDNIDGALQEIGETLGICIINAGKFNDYEELNAYDFKNNTFYALELSGGLATDGGAYICYTDMFKIGSMYIYKYIRGYNLRESKSITVDLVELTITVNEIQITDENKYFSNTGLNSVLQEIGKKLTFICRTNINLFDKNIELVDGYTLPREINTYEETEPRKTEVSTDYILYNKITKINPTTKYILPLSFKGSIGFYSIGGYRYTVATVTDETINGLTKTDSGYIYETKQSEEYMCIAFDKNAEINFDEFMIVEGTGLFVGSRLNREIKLLKEQVIGIEEVENTLQDILATTASTNGFEGKILSILGDSISTFEGYVPTSDGYNLEHRSTYPSSSLLTDVSDTWWNRLITNLKMKLGVNDSWSGTRVSNSSTTDTGSVGPKTHIASMTRISNLGANGNPDLILFFGGTNDIRGNVTLGSFDSTATHTTVDLTSETYSDFATAYKTAIQRLMYMYPKAKIVVILPMVATRDYTIGSLDKYIEIIKNICDYFGVYCIDLRRCGINYFNANKYLPDGLHPNANGMDLMERHIRQQLLSLYSLEEGEITTHNVTNNLNGVVSDKIYVKATRSGEEYTATLITDGENDTTKKVTITMNEEDITSSCYSNSVATIPKVTGDIVITATARTSTNSHAKTIPLTATAETNLAAEIGLVNEYYYNKKWRTALTNGTLVYSLTIPVIEGDKIYSLSFEASDKNGTSEIGRTDNGARITYFNNETAVSGKTPAETYTEFSEYGYITVPAGVNAINISTWLPNNQVIKLLTL